MQKVDNSLGLDKLGKMGGYQNFINGKFTSKKRGKPDL